MTRPQGAPLLAATLVATLATLAATPARAQDPNDPRIAGYLALGFAGDADLDVGDLRFSDSLDVTVGPGARFELPVHEYVVVGGLVEVLTFETDAAGAEREAVVDLDGLVRARYAIEVTPGELWIEPYVGLSFGLSLAVLDDGAGDDEVWPGFNAGVMGGVYVLLDLPVAFFGELGWRHHQVFDERGSILGDVDLKLVTNQLATHFGVAFILE